MEEIVVEVEREYFEDKGAWGYSLRYPKWSFGDTPFTAEEDEEWLEDLGISSEGGLTYIGAPKARDGSYDFIKICEEIIPEEGCSTRWTNELSKQALSRYISVLSESVPSKDRVAVIQDFVGRVIVAISSGAKKEPPE